MKRKRLSNSEQLAWQRQCIKEDWFSDIKTVDQGNTSHRNKTGYVPDRTAGQSGQEKPAQLAR